MKGGLSSWSDEVNTLRTTVTELQSELVKLRDKCENMEERLRRGNIRIVGVKEQPNSASPNAVSKIIKEALRMDQDVKVTAHTERLHLKNREMEKDPVSSSASCIMRETPLTS